MYRCTSPPTMFRSMFRYTYVPNAGRWRTNKPMIDIVNTVDLANHDHCGGDQCSVVPQKKKKVQANAPSTGDDDDDDDNNHMWPFLL